MKYVFLFSLVFLCSRLMAQSGGVAVYKDPRIDLLLKKQAEVNNLSTRNSAKRRTAPGYRLLIISTNNKSDAIAARTKIYSNFPELKPYMWHQSPYFKVKAGNFTSRQDAQAYQKKLAAFFPSGVFIMNDIVEVNPGASEEEE
ncbi:SPOR domain-containing protein [Niabella drilacis]|uniref:Sporulation related domain-containing protein n=1 Tax=Niabella drilacis (strain DSM 25811 / CCM 8410 / CCUG 62505 / LMG 26954 / E90) TaxID=1285928 RepID=A0A1G6WHR4_NIADE|nr:SPOR domain-containing protein [Niabella drilacis]SDD65500.1 Sporulation related domain-containing protein [Niabella drilacis]